MAVKKKTAREIIRGRFEALGMSASHWSTKAKVRRDRLYNYIAEGDRTQLDKYEVVRLVRIMNREGLFNESDFASIESEIHK